MMKIISVLVIKKAKTETANEFITSSPNAIKKSSKVVYSTPTETPKRIQRNLSTEFGSVDYYDKEGSPSIREDEVDTKSTGKKSILDYSFFSPLRYLMPNNSRPSSEKNSPASKTELAADETLAEITLIKEDEIITPTPEMLYDPYNSAVDEEEIEEEEEFDPFLFIANLPPLWSLSPRPRVKLPPKKNGDPKMTLVLDLDETLVHCSTEPLSGAELIFPVTYGGKDYQVHVRKRPHFETFIKRVSTLFEVVVFTASQEVYARKLLDLIDPQGRYIHHRLYRDACVCVEGNYLKDLTVLGRDLSQVVIVDNSPQAFGFQLENGIPIESWFDNKHDRELEVLLPFLEGLLSLSDVRGKVKDTFKLHDRVQKLKVEHRIA